MTGIPFTFHKGIEILAVDRNIYRPLNHPLGNTFKHMGGNIIKVLRYSSLFLFIRVVNLRIQLNNVRIEFLVFM